MQRDQIGRREHVVELEALDCLRPFVRRDERVVRHHAAKDRVRQGGESAGPMRPMPITPTVSVEGRRNGPVAM